VSCNPEDLSFNHSIDQIESLIDNVSKAMHYCKRCDTNFLIKDFLPGETGVFSLSARGANTHIIALLKTGKRFTATYPRGHVIR